MAGHALVKVRTQHKWQQVLGMGTHALEVARAQGLTESIRLIPSAIGALRAVSCSATRDDVTSLMTLVGMGNVCQESTAGMCMCLLSLAMALST